MLACRLPEEVRMRLSIAGTTAKTDTLSTRAARNSATRIPLRPVVKTPLDFETMSNDLGIAPGQVESRLSWISIEFHEGRGVGKVGPLGGHRLVSRKEKL